MRSRRCRRTGKIVFPTSAVAAREIVNAQRARAEGEVSGFADKDGRVETRSYPCEYCGGHHITADPKPPEVRYTRRRRRRS